MCATAIASTTVPGSMLSRSTASAPARAAWATWSRASHSISTIRPGHSARARLTASAMLVPARWLSFTRTASERPERWLVPPTGPHGRLFQDTQARRRLAGVEHRHRRVALVGGGDEVRRQRRHARQAAEEVQRRPLGGQDRPQRPRHLEQRVARRQLVAVGGEPHLLDLGTDAPERLRRAVAARQHAGPAGPQCELRPHVLGHQRRRHVPLGTEVLGQGAADGLAHHVGVTFLLARRSS